MTELLKKSILFTFALFCNSYITLVYDSITYSLQKTSLKLHVTSTSYAEKTKLDSVFKLRKMPTAQRKQVNN